MKSATVMCTDKVVEKYTHRVRLRHASQFIRCKNVGGLVKILEG
jgi:hypothetical protein